jgi:hypothetical protein
MAASSLSSELELPRLVPELMDSVMELARSGKGRWIRKGPTIAYQGASR